MKMEIGLKTRLQTVVVGVVTNISGRGKNMTIYLKCEYSCVFMSAFNRLSLSLPLLLLLVALVGRATEIVISLCAFYSVVLISLLAQISIEILDLEHFL